MKENNFLKNIILNIKYFKNNCVIKYKIIQRERKNGKKIGLNEFLIEIGLIKKHKKDDKKDVTSPKNNKGVSKDKPNKKMERQYLTKENLITVIISFTLISGSFILSNKFFDIEKQFNFYNITQEAESKILNILKSPKTQTSILPYPSSTDNGNNIEYYFNVVDRLDAYTYRIKMNGISDDFKNELLNNSEISLKEISSLQKIESKIVIPYKDHYLINNKYKIKKELVSKNTIDSIYKKIHSEQLQSFETYRNIEVSLIAIMISIVLNIVYFAIKKVISRK